MQTLRPNRPPLIITADDFGRDQACTEQIAVSLQAGLISAASIMANGSHFDRACGLVHENGLADRVGVHLALDEGLPLSRVMATHCVPGGTLAVRRSLWPLSRRLSTAIESELASQIERVLERGIRPTHLDSHRHIHNALPIGRLVVQAARKYGIPYVRPARNLGTKGGAATNTYKWLFNRYVRGAVETADYFGDITDYPSMSELHDRRAVTELMVHLDQSPRGKAGIDLLRNPSFRAFTERFEVVGHARAFVLR